MRDVCLVRCVPKNNNYFYNSYNQSIIVQDGSQSIVYNLGGLLC